MDNTELMTQGLSKTPHSLLEQKRRAYIVLGPEISGTKLLAEILLKCCGLKGQVTDGSLPEEGEDLIMMRWSLPSGLFDLASPQWATHNDRMVDIPSIIETLEKRNYLPVFLGITRSWIAVTKSRLKQYKQHGDSRFGPPDSLDTHLHMVKRGISYFYENVPQTGYPWYMFSYEEITTDPDLCVPQLSKFLNLEFNGLDKLDWPIKGQNSKWFKEDENAEGDPFKFDTWG